MVNMPSSTVIGASVGARTCVRLLLGAQLRLDDVGDQGRVAVDVAAPVLREHHHVLDPADAGEELALLVGQLGVRVVRLGLGPRIAHLGHVVLPGLTGVEALLIEGNSELSHVDPLFGVRLFGRYCLPPSIGTNNITSAPSRSGISRSASSPSTAAVRSVAAPMPITASRSPRVAPAARVWRCGPSALPGRSRRRPAERMTDTPIVRASVRAAS